MHPKCLIRSSRQTPNMKRLPAFSSSTRHLMQGWLTVAGLALLGIGIGGAALAVEDPAQTERLSAVMQRISSQPDYPAQVEALLGGKSRKEFLTPGLVEDLRKLILGRDWQRVDHFPSLTIGALNQSVGVATRAAGKSSEALEAFAPEVGTYAVSKNLTLDLNIAVRKPTYVDDPRTAVRQLPYGLVAGDGPNPDLAPMHAESTRLAQVLNRLAQNPVSGGAHNGTLAVKFGNTSNIVSSDQLLPALVSAGETVTVDDDRYFANFGHLHDHGQDVLMPFWVDMQIVIPGEKRSLIVPVSHSEYELHVRGPRLNADVSFYFGVDGKAEFRTMDSLNEAWVLGRKAHVYTGEQAQTAIRMLSAALRVYKQVHAAHPELAFGGYYTLGVCQDTSAAVEQHLNGKTTLFPLTHEAAMFSNVESGDPEEQEFLREFQKLPNDRGSNPPEVSRVLGALPTVDIQSIPIPELKSDLIKVTAAGHFSALKRVPGLQQRLQNWLLVAGVAAVLLTLIVWILFVRHGKSR